MYWCCDYAGMWYDYDCVECTGSRLIPEYIQLTDHCMEGNIMITHIALTTSLICTSNSGSTNCNTVVVIKLISSNITKTTCIDPQLY